MNSRASVRCRTFGRVDVHELDRHTSYDPNQRPRRARHRARRATLRLQLLDISSYTPCSMPQGAGRQLPREVAPASKEHAHTGSDIVLEYVAHEPALHPQLDLSAPARAAKRVSRSLVWRSLPVRITPHRTFESSWLCCSGARHTLRRIAA